MTDQSNSPASAYLADERPVRSRQRREPWNKGKLVGQKAPFNPKEIWAIRVRLQMEERTREAVEAWIRKAHLQTEDYLFPSRCRKATHIGTRQYARAVHGWVRQLGLDQSAYGTHSMRRTRPH